MQAGDMVMVFDPLRERGATQHHPAIVTFVHNDKVYLNLCVFWDNDRPGPLPAVALVASRDDAVALAGNNMRYAYPQEGA